MLHRFFTLLLSIVICGVCAEALQAQTPGSSTPDHDKQFYVFASRGVLSGLEVGPEPRIRVPSTSSWQFGGGGELFPVESVGLAMGMELACVPNEVNGNPITYRYRTIAGAEAINTVQPSGIKGWLTLNMSYHFRELSPRGTWVPFVTGGVGVTAFALNEPEQSHHYGGGIGIWRSRHRAWRVEYSKHVIADARFRSVRVGLMLR